MLKRAALILAGGLLLTMTACVQQNVPLTPYQQQYYKKQKEYQELGDARRKDNRPCRLNGCM